MAPFRMSHLRWQHLLWLSARRTINHAIRDNVLRDLAGAGLIVKDTDGLWQLTFKGQDVVETERKALESLCRQEHGADINSVYFDTGAQGWMANYNTPTGSALARVSRAGKGKISFHPVR